jgi:hypothetical protein
MSVITGDDPGGFEVSYLKVAADHASLSTQDCVARALSL